MAKNSTRFLKKAGQKLYIMRSELLHNFYNRKRDFNIIFYNTYLLSQLHLKKQSPPKNQMHKANHLPV